MVNNPKVQIVPIEEFIPNQANHNKGKERGEAAIESSIQTYGLHRGISVAANGETFAGSHVLQKAVEVGGFKGAIVVDTEGEYLVVTRRKDIPDARHPKAVAAGIADNRTNQLNFEFDLEQLAEDIEFLREEDYELPNTLFTNDELVDMLSELDEESDEELEEDEGLVDELIDNAESGKIESRVSLGQIWKIGRHRIACGDSTNEGNVRKLLGNRFNDVGMVWADPPFNTKQQQGRTASNWGVIENDDLTDADFEGFIGKLFKIFRGFQSNPSLYVCCHWKSYPVFFKAKGGMNALIVWVKNNFGLGSGYRPQHEFICFWGKIESASESNVWEIAKDSAASYQHPMQKPISLLEKALRNSSTTNDLIFDPFLGSAPSIIAAQQMEGSRTVYGFELSPDYCEVILRRYEYLTGEIAELAGYL